MIYIKNNIIHYLPLIILTDMKNIVKKKKVVNVTLVLTNI